MNKICKSLMILIFAWMLPCCACAQNACDNLFADGVKLQQTMTISSQRKAIEQFEKAKICYDSQAKKDLCDQQITACRNIIAQIRRANEIEKEKQQVPQPSSAATNQDENKPDDATVDERDDVQISFDKTYVKFKGKGGEFQKVKVVCNYDDWEVVEAPEWINYSRSENNGLVIEATQNPNKVERSGVLKISCGGTDASLTIIQSKLKMIHQIMNSMQNK